MTSKDTIATWLLVFFVLVPAGNAFYRFEDALRSHSPVGTILWHLGVALIVAASGLFILVHFVRLTNDLEYHERQEQQREKERENLNLGTMPKE